MKHTDYYKSGQHKENVLKAREQALIKSQELKQQRIQLYYISPNYCTNCNIVLDYDKKGTDFVDLRVLLKPITKQELLQKNQILKDEIKYLLIGNKNWDLLKIERLIKRRRKKIYQ